MTTWCHCYRPIHGTLLMILAEELKELGKMRWWIGLILPNWTINNTIRWRWDFFCVGRSFFFIEMWLDLLEKTTVSIPKNRYKTIGSWNISQKKTRERGRMFGEIDEFTILGEWIILLSRNSQNSNSSIGKQKDAIKTYHKYAN